MPKKKTAAHPPSSAKKATEKRPDRLSHASSPDAQSREPGALTVVGIGASAGGLEAIGDLLQYTPEESRPGEINVALLSEGERYILRISDNGAGFKKEIDLERSATFGLQLVNILAGQLGGVFASPTEVEFSASMRKGTA